MKNTYELTLLIKTTAENVEIEKFIEQVKKHIKETGKIIKDEDLGKKKLAYNINKVNEAKYRLFTLEMEGSDCSSLSAKIKSSDIILRHLLLKLEEKKKSILPKKKE